MQITLPSVANKVPRPRLSGIKLGIYIIVVLTLLLALQVAEFAFSLSRTTPDDPAELKALLSEVQASTIPLDADASTLVSLGFIPADDATAAEFVTKTNVLTSPTALPTAESIGTPTLAPTPLPTSTLASTATPTPTGAELAASSLPTWNATGRVNILLMGLDGNASQGRFRRADSLIVVSIDPATNSAVLIGTPRDLYVTIHSPKGAIRAKINTAYVWGELYNYPGGGPALEMRTIGETLGLPIQHYVSVYFDGFAKLIDAIGGIDIDVKTPIHDSFTGWNFNAGLQHMDGKRALQFARSRYSTSDFSRGRRQEQVILAAVDKMTKAGIIAKLPAILPTVTQAFRSDMSVTDLLSLASLGYRIDLSSIKTAQVDETMCSSYRTPDGQAALMPKWDKINAMVRSALQPVALPTATPVPTIATTASSADAAVPAPTPVIANTPVPTDYHTERATVEILNGTNTIGLAHQTQTWLENRGVNVVRIADAVGIYQHTVLYTDGSSPLTKAFLLSSLSIEPENIRALGEGGVNFRVILGNDFKLP